jgi:hypothetical protein
MSRPLRIASLLLLIFLGGSGVGWLLGRATAPEQPPLRRSGGMMREAVLKHLTDTLQLTPEQRERVSEVLTQWRRQVRRVEAQGIEQRRRMFEEMTSNIRTNLTPEQQRLFENDTLRLELRFQRRLKALKDENP